MYHLNYKLMFIFHDWDLQTRSASNYKRLSKLCQTMVIKITKLLNQNAVQALEIVIPYYDVCCGISKLFIQLPCERSQDVFITSDINKTLSGFSKEHPINFVRGELFKWLTERADSAQGILARLIIAL